MIYKEIKKTCFTLVLCFDDIFIDTLLSISSLNINTMMTMTKGKYLSGHSILDKNWTHA